MKAVILAGGLGKRMRPVTYAIPKPLLPIGDTTIIERQLVRMSEAGVTEVFVSTYYLANKIKRALSSGNKYGLNIRFSDEPEPLGTCGPLGLLVEHISEPFVMLNSDIVTDLDLRTFSSDAATNGSDVTLATTMVPIQSRFGVVSVTEDGHIISLREKPTMEFEVLAGIYYLNPMVFRFIPKGRVFGMDSLIGELLRARIPIRRRLITGTWIDVGEPDDYKRAQEYIRGIGSCPSQAA
jgi:NDP-sugar pyrophosphorylase family protein